jgi:hypothetical protein
VTGRGLALDVDHLRWLRVRLTSWARIAEAARQQHGQVREAYSPRRTLDASTVPTLKRTGGGG